MTTKEKVLNILSENSGKPVSGEKIAETCGISRAAIWKAINGLRQEGINIEGTTNGGYLLQGPADILSLETLNTIINTNHQEIKNCHIECFKEIDSTNSYAKRLLSNCGNLREPDGKLTKWGQTYHKSIFVAESQTAGRGRLGRTFVSPAKTGIYISLIYAPEGGINNPAQVTAFSAVAVCRAIKKLFPVEPKIKWINDIFVNGKKICGILTEGSTNFETGLIESAIIGIGINIYDNPQVFTEEVAIVAGGITNNQSQNSITRAELSAQVAAEVFSVLEENTETIMAEYKQLSFLLGKTVSVHPIIGDTLSVYEAKVIDIDNNAGLIVSLADGTNKTLNSGEVSLHSESQN